MLNKHIFFLSFYFYYQRLQDTLNQCAVIPFPGLRRGSERGEPRLHRGARQVDHQPMERVGGKRTGMPRGRRRRRAGSAVGRQATGQYDARRGRDTAQFQVLFYRKT